MKPESNSGKSKSNRYPQGKRRMKHGKEMAPKSARRNGKNFLFECTETEIKKAEI